MDVRCERCRAQHALDDDRITETGVTIRCSKCGYTFRVKRKALFVTVPVGPDEPPDPAEAPRPVTAGVPTSEKREWRVRQANGNVFTLKELTTLQKWIVERKVGRDDEISLYGDQWKRLGDISELSSFFHVVEAADRAHSVGPPAFAFSSVSPASPPAPSSPVASEAAAAAWETKPAAPLRGSAPEPAWAVEGELLAPVREKPGREGPPIEKGGRGGKLALVLVVLAIAGGAAVYVIRPGWLRLGQAPSPRTESVPASPAPAPIDLAAPKLDSAAPVAQASSPPAPAAAPSGEAQPPPAPAATPSSEPMPPQPPPETAPVVEAKPKPSPTGVPSTAEAMAPPSTASAPNSAKAKPSTAPETPEEARAEPASAQAASAAPKQSASDQPVSASPAPQVKPGPRKEISRKESAARRLRALSVQARKLRDRGKPQEALAIYDKAADLDPTSPDVFAGQGWCYLDLSQYVPAVEHFEAALRQAPNHPAALMGLAETYRYQGRNADAIRYYRKYLAAHPNGDDAPSARTAISQLKE